MSEIKPTNAWMSKTPAITLSVMFISGYSKALSTVGYRNFYFIKHKHSAHYSVLLKVVRGVLLGIRLFKQ